MLPTAPSKRARSNAKSVVRRRRPERRPSSSRWHRPRLEVLENRITPAAGQLDPTFGTGGVVTTHIAGYNDDPAYAIAVQPDGKIVTGGWATNGGNTDFAVARYDTGGNLDPTFGSGGIVTTDFGGGTKDTAMALALQPDGKIVLAGFSSDGTNPNDFALARYDSTGKLDTTFGKGGLVTTDFNNSEDIAVGVTVQADGYIVATGLTFAGGGGENIALARYDTKGSLDPTFGNGGRVITDVSQGNDNSYEVAVQPDGRIVVTGNSGTPWAVVRYLPDGTLDPTFGNGGIVRTAVGAGHAESHALALQRDGKIVTGGWSFNGRDTDFALARYNADGTLDPTFGNGGTVITDLGATEEIDGLAIQLDGAIVAGGYRGMPNPDHSDMALARYDPSGNLDPTFGSGGKSVVALPAWSNRVWGVAFEPDGSIIAGGNSAISGGLDIAVARLSGTPNHRGLAIGPSFTGSSLSQSGQIPPDTDGAVGPTAFVELVNGRYAAYGKTDGTLLQSSTVDQFWQNAGLAGETGTFDPRVVYDPASQRWFASSADHAEGPNNLLLAVSQSSDPTAGWHGFRIDSDASDMYWADFPTLGVDADGVYLAANMFPVGAGNELVTVVSVPKADLLLPTPTVANLTEFQNQSQAALGSSIQPALDFEPSDGRAALLATDATSSTVLHRTDVLNAGGPGASLSVSTDVGINPADPPPSADQPGPKLNLDAGDNRFSGSVYQVGGDLWAVQTIDVNGRAALRWYEISATSNTVLQSGTISDLSLSFFEPSIAANAYGEVVIGFSGTSPSQYPSAYAVWGTTAGGVTTFRGPVLLKVGVSDYQVTYGGPSNRWGDYSATSIDPTNPHAFWTIQEWVSATDQWSTQATQLIFDSAPPTADVVDVTPNPRTTPVDAVTIAFSEPVTGFDLSDLRLTRDGSANLLTGSQTLTTGDNKTWVLGNLTGLTGTTGGYTLTLTAAGSGITDAAGNALAADAADSWTTTSPALSVNDVAVIEGNSGTTPAMFTVSLSVATSQTVTVHYATANGTAVASGDYTAASGTLTFAAGETSKTVTVAIKGDTSNEPDETFFLNLSAPTNATIADGQGQGTILNDDATLAVDSPTYAAEGNSGFGYLAFTVSLTGVHSIPVTVSYATSNGTATSGADFGPTSGTLTFAPSDTSQQVLVPILGDTLNEANETFKLTLSKASNAATGKATGTGTITDDDPLPSLSVGDVTAAEGNSGTTSLVFTVTLSAPSGRTVTVAYTTADHAATAGSDYTAQAGTLTFAAGTTSKTVTVAATGDTAVEPDEDFYLNLSAPSGATIARGQAVGGLLNDDPNPLLFITDAKVAEGNAGTKTLSFKVSLSAASATAVTVNWATSPGTATAGTDYTSASGVLTIPAGTLSKTVSVTIKGDTAVEPDETFFVTLSGPSANAGLGRAVAVGTIQNDDTSLAVGNALVVEGNSGLVALTFSVSLTGANTAPVTVHYATANGSTNPATAGTDYVAAAGDLTFAPGETSKQVTVWVIGDHAAEADEQLTLKLTNPVNAVLGQALGTGTILNDD